MPNNLSVIILTENCIDTLEKSLESVKFADEIVIIDHDSSDGTLELAAKYTSQIFSSQESAFDTRRNIGMHKASNPWIFYLDSDEVVTKALQKEILSKIGDSEPANYACIRDNFFLGVKMYPDTVQRLFHKKTLLNWKGEVHETPIYQGKIITLKNHLLHDTHRSVETMLEKTNKWSDIEAKLRLEAGHPQIKPWRVIRIALTESYNQFVKKRVQQYGPRGWVEGLFQVIDKMIVFIKLWEMQQK